MKNEEGPRERRPSSLTLDGKSDLVQQNNTTGDVASWQMNGFAFTGAMIATPGTTWVVRGSGDYNGDSKGDVLLRNSSTGEVAGWLMNGSAISGTGIIASPGAGWEPKLP